MILHGDSLHELRTLDDDSVDAVITDPPYGYSFMGKDWDKAVPSVDIWRECLRVLKPGAFCMVMSAPRSDVQNAMISRLMEAGFRLDFTPIYWTYASGFPKAGNVGKLVDKRNGRAPEWYSDFARHYGEQRKAKGLTHNAICEAAKAYATHNHGGASTNWEKGYNVPTLEQWNALQPLLDLSLEFLPMIEREEAERQVIAERKGAQVESTGKYGGWGNDSGDGRSTIKDTLAATDQAKALDGSYTGFQPKPAVEVIIVAMKPLSEKTYVDQALKNGKGITWLDDCRIPTGDNRDRPASNSSDTNFQVLANRGSATTGHDGGRFPANLLVEDNVLGNHSKFFNLSVWNEGGDNGRRTTKPMDSADRSDQANGRGEAPQGSRTLTGGDNPALASLPFLIVPKASKSEKNKGLEHIGANKNHHPTVKPLKLMSYLITLTTRPGDTVLDPFVGSGTTVVAAKQLDRIGIGIEREAEYAEIARARLAHVHPQLTQLPVEKPEPAEPPLTVDDLTQVNLLEETL